MTALAIVRGLPRLIAYLASEADPDQRVITLNETLTTLERALQPAAATFMTVPQIDSIHAA